MQLLKKKIKSHKNLAAGIQHKSRCYFKTTSLNNMNQGMNTQIWI